MKKRLESELISIAHRILKLKNKSEVDQLYKETQKLYETLAVLKFYQDNFESVKSDVSEVVLEEKLEQHFENQILNKDEPITKPVEEASVKVLDKPESVIESSLEKVSEEAIDEPTIVSEKTKETAQESEPKDDEKPLFKPSFELEIDAVEAEPADQKNSESIKQIETEIKPNTKHVALHDLLGENYVDPIFVKPNEVSLFESDTSSGKQAEQTKFEAPKTTAINDAHSKSIAIGLNDRIGFVQHLFKDSNEDFNRVISQLNTFDTFEEAKDFINEMVIPDYNYWVGEEDYIERFMAIVEKKFV
ncbi:hypothetical protein [Flavobacterium sp.]|uniref:hypothetical protein n=1 Tax=Flavobacterium sp. TaxID=239 RepID=UPI0025F2FD8C|nr:hypothetical protein [Flavobacterium sp.]